MCPDGRAHRRISPQPARRQNAALCPPGGLCVTGLSGVGDGRLAQRLSQDTDRLNLARLHQFVHGYASTLPLPPSAARALPVCLYGRGLQMIAKRAQAGQPETGMLSQAEWIAANATPRAEAVAAALS
jgi:hypothetical protein